VSHLPVPIGPTLGAADIDALRTAVTALERTSFASRLSGVAGRQIGLAGRLIPQPLQEAATAAAHKALEVALQVALSSVERNPVARTDAKHRRLAMVSGAIGGAIGFAALPFELPVSTTIMLRSILEIARDEGEDLSTPEARMACLQVFALGGPAQEDNVLEGGYLVLRGVLAKSVSDAARYVAQNGVAAEGAPIVVSVLRQIASRFGVVVSQKAAAQAAPIFGAVSGATINFAFADHFQQLARGHFTVRRLERIHGPVVVREHYARIARDNGYWRTDGAA
jgi:hypothetical protein